MEYKSKQEYESPEMEIINLENEDIITTSGDHEGGEGGGSGSILPFHNNDRFTV